MYLVVSETLSTIGKSHMNESNTPSSLTSMELTDFTEIRQEYKLTNKETHSLYLPLCKKTLNSSVLRKEKIDDHNDNLSDRCKK